jgi:hypothetical protein
MRKPLVFILIVFLIFYITISAQEDNESQEEIFTQRRQSNKSIAKPGHHRS